MGAQLLAYTGLLALAAVISVDLLLAATLVVVSLMLVSHSGLEIPFFPLVLLVLLVGTSPSLLRLMATSAWASFFPKNLRLDSVSGLLFCVCGLFFLAGLDIFQPLLLLASQQEQALSPLALSHFVSSWYGALLSLGLLFFLPALFCSLVAELPFAYARFFSRWGLGYAGLGLRSLLTLAVCALCFQFWAEFSKQEIESFDRFRTSSELFLELPQEARDE